MELRPKKLVHFVVLLIAEVLGRDRGTRRQVEIIVRRTLLAVQQSIFRIPELHPQHKGLSSRDISGLT